MYFENNPINWENEGIEPSDSIKTSGFEAGYKPPADYFNSKWNRDYKCIKELQEKLSDVDDTTQELQDALKGNVHCITVAAPDTPENFKKYANYVCESENAQTVINQAITSANGGTVYLMQGTYNCSGNISIQLRGTTLCGVGVKSWLSIECENKGIEVFGDNVTIKDLQIDFTDTQSVAGQFQGAIHLNGMSGLFAKYCTIQGNVISSSGHALSDANSSSGGGVGEYTRIINNTFASGDGVTAYSFRDTNKFLSGNVVNDEFTDSLEV